MRPGKINTSFPINWRHPLARGLVACWLPIPGRIGGGKLYDLAGQNHGALTNGAAWIGDKLSFDGTDDEVNVPAAESLQVTSSYTTSTWITPTAIGAAQLVYMYDNRHVIFSGAIIISVEPDGRMIVVHQNGSSNDFIYSASAITASRTHIAVSHGDGATTIYINGASSGGAQSQRDPVYDGAGSATGAHIGRYNDGTITADPFNGAIEDVRIYNRALSAAEVKSLYNDPLGILNRVRPRRVSPVVAANSPLLLRLASEGLFVGSHC